MKTDHPIYQFLSTGAEAFRVVTGGQELVGSYTFCSLTIKGIERRMDGIFEPKGHNGPVYIVEFQAQKNEAAWYNLLTKVGLYGEQYPQRDVYGLLIFLREKDTPCMPSGASQANSLLRAVYLEQFLPQWLAREPDNPFVAVFAPLIISDEVALRQCASTLWRTVETAQLTTTVRQSLQQVLEYWFFERFRAFSAEEIWNMLNILAPVEETRAYQSIFAKGEARGEVRGEVKGEAKLLTRQLTRRFGSLPAWVGQRLAVANAEQIERWADAVLDSPTLDAVFKEK